MSSAQWGWAEVRQRMEVAKTYTNRIDTGWLPLVSILRAREGVGVSSGPGPASAAKHVVGLEVYNKLYPTDFLNPAIVFVELAVRLNSCGM